MGCAWTSRCCNISSLNSHKVNVSFVKYGSELSDQQMEQIHRREDTDMNMSSKRGMSIEDQKSLNKMTISGFRLTKWMSSSGGVLSVMLEGDAWVRPNLALDIDNLPVERP